jgi:hypothetical protein
MDPVNVVMDNRTILQKADMALADLLGDGGLLQPAQAQKFIRILIRESVVMKLATVTPMRSPKQLIEKIRFNSRILRAGHEGVALPVGSRAKPDLSKVELDAKLFKAEVRLNNEVLEDSIERDQLRQTIMQLMGERIAADMDEVVVSGDTTSGDSFLAQFDGLLVSATSKKTDALGQTTNKTLFRDMLKTMPREFLRNRLMMRFLTSVSSEIDYRDSLSSRVGELGDRALESNVATAYAGIPVIPVPYFPQDLGGGFDETQMILTDPKNFDVGVWRQIRFETDKNISEGVLIIVATMRFDFKYVEETAVVKASHVKVGV